MKRSYQSTNQLITDRQSVGLDVLPRELFSRNRGEGKLIAALGEGRGQPEVAAMSRSKQTSKGRGRRRVVTALGVAGALSLAGGASASIGPAGDIPTQNTAPVILAEEEISDVSLATFYVFDKENAGAHRSGVQLAARACGRGCRGCAVHRGCGGCAAAPCTEAAAAAQSEAAEAAEEAAEEAAVSGLDPSGSARFSMPSRGSHASAMMRWPGAHPSLISLDYNRLLSANGG